jgi:hypothetical protein
VFNGEYGVNYAFRARATDVLGNQGAWPGSPQLYVSVIRSAEFVSTLYMPSVNGSTEPGSAPR